MLARIPYEFRVAVTGHRSIPDELAVERAIERVLDRITSTLDKVDVDATPIAWTIVSPLARGADQLAAKTLLERVAARLEVLTPFPWRSTARIFPPMANWRDSRACWHALPW